MDWRAVTFIKKFLWQTKFNKTPENSKRPSRVPGKPSISTILMEIFTFDPKIYTHTLHQVEKVHQVSWNCIPHLIFLHHLVPKDNFPCSLFPFFSDYPIRNTSKILGKWNNIKCSKKHSSFLLNELINWNYELKNERWKPKKRNKNFDFYYSNFLFGWENERQKNS